MTRVSMLYSAVRFLRHRLDRVLGLPGQSVEQPVSARPLAAFDELPVVQQHALGLELRDGGVYPGPRSPEFGRDGFLPDPDPAGAVRIGGKGGVDCLGGHRDTRPPHHRCGNGSPAAAHVLSVHGPDHLLSWQSPIKSARRESWISTCRAACGKLPWFDAVRKSACRAVRLLSKIRASSSILLPSSCRCRPVGRKVPDAGKRDRRRDGETGRTCW